MLALAAEVKAFDGDELFWPQQLLVLAADIKVKVVGLRYFPGIIAGCGHKNETGHKIMAIQRKVSNKILAT